VLSVWNQQKSYFESIKEDWCLREMFVNDLMSEVATWLEQGDQLVVGGDINEDVKSCLCSRRLQDIGLIEILTHTHGLDGPPTYNRGSIPIDVMEVYEQRYHVVVG
jgi:hypothetical protein